MTRGEREGGGFGKGRSQVEHCGTAEQLVLSPVCVSHQQSPFHVFSSKGACPVLWFLNRGSVIDLVWTESHWKDQDRTPGSCLPTHPLDTNRNYGQLPVSLLRLLDLN